MIEFNRRASQEAGTNHAYEWGGNLTAVTDQVGRFTHRAFGSFDRVMAQILQTASLSTAAAESGYDYSHQDRLLSVADPRKLTI